MGDPEDPYGGVYLGDPEDPYGGVYMGEDTSIFCSPPKIEKSFLQPSIISGSPKLRTPSLMPVPGEGKNL